MASNDDILVPDFTYFIENDLRRAIQELDESSSIDPVQPISVVSPSTASDSTASTSTFAASRTKKKKSKKKKQPPNDGKVRKFVSPYAVFADIRLKAQKAAGPDKQTAIIWKETAKEWGRMTRIEKAPYVKEFENRRRLYELENPNATFKTPGRPSQGGRTVFRFAPYRKSKDNEVSRIEHLPQCPILTKRKIYEEAILEPLQPAKQYGRSNSLQKEVPTTAIASPTSPATSPACNGCPRVFSVCDYCRGLGFEGRRILHFESDCWTKARHKRNQRFKVQNPKQEQMTEC